MPADSDTSVDSGKLFGRQRDIHEILGGGKVADILLWRDKRLSSAVLVLITAVWLLFEVAEYNFLTLVCHAAIAAMLVVFAWTNIVAFLGVELPEIPNQVLTMEAVRETALSLHAELVTFLSFLHRVARGEDPKLFLLTVAGLWVISVVGNFCSSLTLLYLGYLGLQALPFLYETYEEEVERLAWEGGRDFRKLYGRLDEEVLSRIPRGPRASAKNKML